MNKHNLFVIDCDWDEIAGFYDVIKNAFNDRELEIYSDDCTIPLNKSRKGIFGEIKRYFNYFFVAWKIFWRRNEYEMIFCWQQFYALIFCLYSGIFHTKKRNLVIACNYTYKEKNKFRRIYHYFMKKCMNNYLDFIHVPSMEYADIIAREFGFDRDRIITAAFGIPDYFDKYKDSNIPIGETDKGYYFSVGRSNRDFDFLIEAWGGQRLVIASDTYAGITKKPNIVIKNDISADDQYEWIMHSKAIIIPIDKPKIASGDTTLLTAMSFGQIVVVTRPSTLAEMYIEDEWDGITIEKNAESLRDAIDDIEAGRYNVIGPHARQKYLDKFSRVTLAKNLIKGILPEYLAFVSKGLNKGDLI